MKSGGGGGPAQADRLAGFVPHRGRPSQPQLPNLVFFCVPGVRQQIRPPGQPPATVAVAQQYVPVVLDGVTRADATPDNLHMSRSAVRAAVQAAGSAA